MTFSHGDRVIYGGTWTITLSCNINNDQETEKMDYKGIGTEESDGSSWAGSDLSMPVKRDSVVKNCWSKCDTFPCTRNHMHDP